VVSGLRTKEGEHHQGAKPGKATTANVNHSWRRLRHELEQDEIKSIAVPKPATGEVGLEWSEVLPLIGTNLADLEIPVYVYSHYQKGVQANEAGV
jgi:O-acetyl-ADP-ribose deacetylase (regulator of RNase III)